MLTPCRRSSRKWFRSAAPNAKIAPSTTTNKAPWNSKSGKAISNDLFLEKESAHNMATGATTRDLAVISIDGTKGTLPQTRRHAFIASLLGITNVLAAVNKMDLAGYREDVFRKLQDDFLVLAAQLGISNVQCVPISALEGDNVVDRSTRMPGYHGPTLLEHLQTVPLPEKNSLQSFRFPVQTVIRPDATFRD